jgi:hypothetical protein
MVSARADLATEHSVKRRALIESPWFQQRWGDRFRLATAQIDAVCDLTLFTPRLIVSRNNHFGEKLHCLKLLRPVDLRDVSWGAYLR